MATLGLEMQLRALKPLATKRPDKKFAVMLGEGPGYRWTINGRTHGEHEPFDVRQGDRVEMTFMNPTTMMHPMHLHGHHFQVVGVGRRRFVGAVRDTVIVPAHTPVTIAFDGNHKGSWFMHCHHLYHMATGMMTEVRIS
jgi:FtsP/CotA-like multicopper oxidase with cupredoxin domain